MAGGKRQRQQHGANANANAKKQAVDAKQPSSAAVAAMDERAIDKELKKVNDMLQKEETSQKQTWQIGKRLKKLMETYPSMATQKTIDAFFLWGTALARLASLNEDPTLAEAAVDKFQEMAAISKGDDSAMGPVGYSLWASSLLIIATETRRKDVLDQALDKFQVRVIGALQQCHGQAVEVDGGTTFETSFQYAKALKDGGDLVKFLEAEGSERSGARESSYVDYYKRALTLCVKLEKVYEEESAKADQGGASKAASATDGAEKGNASDSEGHYDEDDEDDDQVLLEDFAEVKLLEAILHGAIENEESSSERFNATLALFEKALEMSPGSPDALMELASYVSKKYLDRRSTLQGVDWEKVFHDIEEQYKSVLTDAGFDMAECHEICVRKDTKQQEEPEEEEIDERVPHLLNSLGKALASFAIGQQQQTGSGSSRQGKGKKKKKQPADKSSHFVHAVEVLRSAHHFHDKLGCYPLAWLYAHPGIEDEENCRTWLETAESYGVLDEELQVPDFTTMHDKEWFQKFLLPVEELGEDEIEGEASDDDEKSGDEGGAQTLTPPDHRGDTKMEEFLSELLQDYDGKLLEIHLEGEIDDNSYNAAKLDISVSLASSAKKSTIGDSVPKGSTQEDLELLLSLPAVRTSFDLDTAVGDPSTTTAQANGNFDPVGSVLDVSFVDIDDVHSVDDNGDRCSSARRIKDDEPTASTGRDSH